MRVDISTECNTCEIVATEFELADNEISIDYTCHACDGYFSDNDVSVNISKEKAIEIISILQNFYKL